MRKIIYLVAVVFLYTTFYGCSDLNDNSNFDGMLGFGQDYEPEPPVVKEPTLKDRKGWEIDTLDVGYIHYSYNNLYAPQQANQIVNVLEIDLNDPNYKIEFIYNVHHDSLSSVGVANNAIAGINGTFELEASYVKTNGAIYSQPTILDDDLRFWMHEGFVDYNGLNVSNIGYGTVDDNNANTSPNILTGGPLLIDNHEPVGKDFVGDLTGVNVNALDVNDYRKFGSVRHPRTVISVTDDNKLLMVTIDGRRAETAGMNAAEMTQFMDRYFKPKSALNLDGGGSSTMWIKDSKQSPNGVVNYPNDNNKFDHYGQRRLRTFILIKKVSDDDLFAGGTGTQNDPYIITSAFHMNSMHKLKWEDSATNPIYFKMEADVDMAGISWLPLANTSAINHHLHFDGNGHVIKNLTSKGWNSASLFGILIGTCKDLGVINAHVVSTNDAGIIAAHTGHQRSDRPVGSVIRCYTSGYVAGPDIVGGITGNIGKNFNSEVGGVYDSYSTATVEALNTTGNSRAGGIVGIIWAGGEMKNTYSTGKVTSNVVRAAGIAAWNDGPISGSVAMNAEIKTANKGLIGRISSTRSSAQITNSWGLEGLVMLNGGVQVTDSELVTELGSTTFDGPSKSKEFLLDINNYSQIGWKVSGQDQVWSSTMNAKGYPILLWTYNRGDFDKISGH